MAETTTHPFLFWLQQFMDEPSNDILRKRSRYSENYFKRHFECDQVQGMKLSEMWKAENRLNYWFCSCLVSLMRYIQIYRVDIQHIVYNLTIFIRFPKVRIIKWSPNHKTHLFTTEEICNKDTQNIGIDIIRYGNYHLAHYDRANNSPTF